MARTRAEHRSVVWSRAFISSCLCSVAAVGRIEATALSDRGLHLTLAEPLLAHNGLRRSVELPHVLVEAVVADLLMQCVAVDAESRRRFGLHTLTCIENLRDQFFFDQ